MAILVAGSLPLLFGAGSGKQLQRGHGTIGYATSLSAADFKPVFAKFDLPDEDWAVTQRDSAAVLAMPDGSFLTLGENTKLMAGSFDRATPGAIITLDGGSLQFDIRHPQSGTANYRFATPTASVVVRGASGSLSFLKGVTTVACKKCDAEGVSIAAAGQTLPLISGQTVTVSATGVISPHS